MEVEEEGQRDRATEMKWLREVAIYGSLSGRSLDN